MIMLSKKATRAGHCTVLGFLFTPVAKGQKPVNILGRAVFSNKDSTENDSSTTSTTL